MNKGNEKLKKLKTKESHKEISNSRHNLPHHKVSHLFKIIIWVILILISFVLVIYVLGSPRIISPKSLDYHPLFTFFQWQFKVNNLNPKKLLRELFPQQKSQKNPSNIQKSSRKLKTQDIINIVYGNATQCHHFDNWLFLGDYISFLVNKHNTIIQQKIMTHKFAELYKRLKSQTQVIEKDQVLEYEIESEMAQKNEAAFFRFSDQFQSIIESEDVYIQDLGQKKFMQKMKDFIDEYIIRFHDYFKSSDQSEQIQTTEQNQVWILWLLHLEGQELSVLKKQLQTLQRRYPTDKFIVLSFYPIFQKQNRSIDYQHINKRSFKKLFKTFLNSSNTCSNLISKSYEYSLLALSRDVHDQEMFTMYHLVGGRVGYSNLEKIPMWVLDKVQRLCKGQKSKTEKMLMQDQKIHFYRMGIYKMGAQIVWKNKQSKKNYEFQTGRLCKKIPIFHNDYISMFETFRKTYIGSLFKI